MAKEKKDISNYTEFSDQPERLYCRGYECTDAGVYTAQGAEVCMHPILPTGTLRNVETGEMSMIVAFNAAGYWEERIYPRNLLASSASILSLASAGVAVSSANAKALSTYLTKLCHMNDDILPRKSSIGRLGWVSPLDSRFAPYSKDLVFDGEEMFREKYRSVSLSGRENTWIAVAAQLRKESFAARLTLAASCASALLTPLELQPFFLHIWGKTGLGKTVLLQFAASVWGDPRPGKLITTFNSTGTGLEVNAGFLHDIPLCVDELQILSSAGSVDFQQLIYTLCEGIGRTRGAKDGGLRKMNTWNNIMITTGERPLGADNFYGGAINRSIEFELTEPVTRDFPALVETLQYHYGYPGRRFVQTVAKYREKLRPQWKQRLEGLTALGVSGKQAAAMAAVILADGLCEMLWFHQREPLPSISYEQAAALLLKENELSTEQKAVNYLFDVIAANPARFPDDLDPYYKLELWGRKQGEYYAVIGTYFNKIMEDGGFSPRAVLSYAAKNGMLQRDGTHLKKNVYFNGNVTRCVVMKRGNPI